MSAGTLALVAVLGGLGSIARFLLGGRVTARVGDSFPYGTLAVNVTAALVLGVLAGATLSPDAYQIFGTGLMGGFSTFSTWMLESRRLAEDGRRGSAAANFAISLALGLGAVWLGRAIA